MAIEDLPHTAFSERFNAGADLLKIKRWPTYDGKELDRNAYLTASEAGACLRKSAYEKSGAKPKKSGDDPDWTGVQQRGDAIENFVVDAMFASLDDAKEALFWFGVDQVSVYSDETHLSATMDGLVLKKREGWLVPHEIKSVDPRTQFENWTAPRDKHRYQMITGAAVLREIVENGKLKEHWPEIYEAAAEGVVRVFPYSAILYVDANNVRRNKSFMVKTSFSPTEENVAAEIIGKARALFPKGKLAAPEDMPAEGVINGACTYCDFKYLCSAHKQFFDPNDTKFKPPVQRSNVTTMMRNFAIAQQKKDEAEEVYESLKPGIKALIATNGEKNGTVTVLETSRYCGKLEEVSGRKTLDKAEVAKELGKEIPDTCYKVGAPSLRLTFTTTKE